MDVTRESWGSVAEGPVDRYTLDDGRGLRVRVLTYGAIVQSVEVPGRDGRPADVALGFGSVDGYVAHPGPYFGAVVGRYANRIAGGRFTLDGTTYELPINNGPNSLHGGAVGFDKRIWSAAERPDGVVLTLVSPDGDQGYPGTLTATVTYTVDGGALRIDYQATTDAPTVVNLTNHCYFNLAGEGSGDILGHLLRIDAARHTPVDGTLIPDGGPQPVDGTPMDFRAPTAIGARIRAATPQLLRAQGYDHNWVLDGTGLRPVAQVTDPASGRTLTVHTTEPGLQFYSGNFLDGAFAGTGGRAYRQGDGLALETQHFPDSPNRPDFPSTVLRPGEEYTSTTVWEFGVAPTVR
jgi:aldose 1-epimerase